MLLSKNLVSRITLTTVSQDTLLTLGAIFIFYKFSPLILVSVFLVSTSRRNPPVMANNYLHFAFRRGAGALHLRKGSGNIWILDVAFQGFYNASATLPELSSMWAAFIPRKEVCSMLHLMYNSFNQFLIIFKSLWQNANKACNNSSKRYSISG